MLCDVVAYFIFCVLLNDALYSADYTKSNDRIIVNIEWERMFKEKVVTVPALL
jgi:hypothetical protein